MKSKFHYGEVRKMSNINQQWIDVELSILIPSEFTEDEAMELMNHFTSMILKHSDVEGVGSSDIVLRPYDKAE
jgi:hypothetical protein